MNRLDLPSYRYVIDQVVPFVRLHFGKLFLVAVFPCVFATTSIALFQHRMIGSMVADPMAALAWGAAMMAFVVVLMLLLMVVYVVVTHAANEAFHGRVISISRAWRFAVSWRSVFTLFLVAAATFASFLLCLLPFFVVAPLTALVVAVMVAEHRFGIEAIQRSAQLVWWNGTGRITDSGMAQVGLFLFVAWVVQNMLTLTAQGPLLVVQQILILREASAGGVPDMSTAMGPLWLNLVNQALAGVVATIMVIFMASGLLLLFSHLRRRREAGDLRSAIWQLSSGDDAPRPDAVGLSAPAASEPAISDLPDATRA